jgi:hypothetical protein
MKNKGGREGGRRWALLSDHEAMPRTFTMETGRAADAHNGMETGGLEET